MVERLEKRLLVIDDAETRICASVRLFGDSARNLHITRWNKEPYDLRGITIEVGGEEEIRRVLEEEPYRFILLDGNLGLKLDNSPYDGDIISRRLRRGVYGETSKSTPILSTSDTGMSAIPLADGHFCLGDSTSKEDVEKLFSRYK